MKPIQNSDAGRSLPAQHPVGNSADPLPSFIPPIDPSEFLVAKGSGEEVLEFPIPMLPSSRRDDETDASKMKAHNQQNPMAHYPQDPAVVCLRHSTQAAIVLRWLQDCLNAKMASHYPSNNPEIAQEMQMQIVHLNIKLKEALRGFLHCTVEGFEEFLQMGDEGHIAVIERARVLPAGPSSDC